jgi:hypothetical protein
MTSDVIKSQKNSGKYTVTKKISNSFFSKFSLSYVQVKTSSKTTFLQNYFFFFKHVNTVINYSFLKIIQKFLLDSAQYARCDFWRNLTPIGAKPSSRQFFKFGHHNNSVSS